MLVPLLFLMYATHLSHPVQACDIQPSLFYLLMTHNLLFHSCLRKKINEAMLALSNAFHSISKWLSANRLVLNPTKTEFLPIGRPQQLSKLTSHCLPLTSDINLTPGHFARNLGFIIHSTLSCHNQMSAPK